MSIHDINDYKIAKKALRETKMLQQSIDAILALSVSHVNTFPHMNAIYSLANEARVVLDINHKKYQKIIDEKGKLNE